MPVDHNHCIGIKSTGEVCGKRCTGNNTRCSVHLNTLANNGPHTLARKEMGYIHKKQIADIRIHTNQLIQAANTDIERRRIYEDERMDLEVARARQHREMATLVRQQEDEILRTGVNPDAAAQEAQQVRQRIAMENHNQRIIERNQRMQEDAELRLALRVAELQNRNNNVEQHRPAPRAGELGVFARDNQNVHTTTAVKQTKDMVERILKIPIPTEYKWNMRVCSKTPGEIITSCGLTPKGAWQMSAKYCQDEDVYDMGKGIYGKVLDGVWQYILGSSDKTDLCRILRQEMEDNIGMCAQGNLTRLCNILAGYMEGIGVQESPAEILGRKLPQLMGIEDQTERLNAAYRLLVETGIPEEQWLSWVEPLVENGSLRLKSTGAGQVIGFETV